MYIEFTIINPKPYENDFEKAAWERAEGEIKQRIWKILDIEDLKGLHLHVEIDMQNNNAKLKSTGIPEDKINIAQNIFKKLS
ncbi:hypothetical protein [Chryseobacterium phocaeense]|uniref:hypothetical protein n=1 Tax=Chryseobacterium phocaeense TaxID=1816690 RepID=UPI0009B9A017|nr:hypothetical protein [Chryseobacterium phocaeense]